MFVITKPQESDDMLEYIRNVQEELFTPLGLHMKVLDMPPHELGAPAYRYYRLVGKLSLRLNYTFLNAIIIIIVLHSIVNEVGMDVCY